MRTTLLLPLTLLTACASPSGIWLLDIPWQDDATACDTTVDENFTDAELPGGGGGVSDWTEGERYEGSDRIAFAQIETYGNGQAILVLGTTVYPGIEDGDGWVFSFEKSTEDQSWDEHTEGYKYTTTVATASTTTYTFALIDNDVATVEVESESEETWTWLEADKWGEEVADAIGTRGQIPADEWLVVDDPDWGPSPAENDWEVQDCQGNNGDCRLSVSTSCTGSGEFTATRTDYDNSDYYDYMNGAGQ